jgi:hypothetical protein
MKFRRTEQKEVFILFEVFKEDYDDALTQIKTAGIPILHQHVWKKVFGLFTFTTPITILLR